MAKKDEKTYPYKSRFGSHADMIVESWDAVPDEDKQKLLPPPAEDEVICRDEFGYYKTFKNRIDNNGVDPRRYEITRIARLFAGRREK